MMKINTPEPGEIHICIVDFVACDDVDICIVKDYDQAGL